MGCIVATMQSHLLTSGIGLWQKLPMNVRKMSLIGIELTILQLAYSLLARLGGFRDVV